MGVFSNAAGVGVEVGVMARRVVEPGSEANDLLEIARQARQVGAPGRGPVLKVFAGGVHGAAALPDPAGAALHCLGGVAGGLPLSVPVTLEGHREGVGVAGDGRFQALELGGGVGRCDAGGRVGAVQFREGGVALFAEGEDVVAAGRVVPMP